MPDVGGFVGDCGRSVKPCERDHRDERSVSERRWSSVRAGGHWGSAVVVDILVGERGGCMGKRSVVNGRSLLINKTNCAC